MDSSGSSDSSSYASSSSTSDLSSTQLSDCNIQDCGPPKPKGCKPKPKGCKPKPKPKGCKPKRKPKKKSCGSKGKCAKPGKVTRNPFLNFLRDFRKQNCGKSMTKISKEGACAWKKMKECEKEKYRKMACSAPKSKRRHKKSKGKKKGCRRF